MSMIFLRFYILCQSFIKSASPVLIVSLVPWVYLLAGEDFVVVTFAYFFISCALGCPPENFARPTSENISPVLT